KRRPAEKSKPLGIIVVAVKNISVEKVPVRMRLNKKTFSSMDKTEKNRAMHPVVIKRDPKVPIDHLQSVDMVIPHAVVFRQDDLDKVSPNFEFVAEPVNNVRESSHLCNRGTFRRDHYYIHFLPPKNTSNGTVCCLRGITTVPQIQNSPYLQLLFFLCLSDRPL